MAVGFPVPPHRRSGRWVREAQGHGAHSHSAATAAGRSRSRRAPHAEVRLRSMGRAGTRALGPEGRGGRESGVQAGVCGGRGGQWGGGQAPWGGRGGRHL